MGNFKDLRVWQDAVDLAVDIYKICQISPFNNDYVLRNQIQRAAISISSNIAEGENRTTNKESAYFINVAKGSTAEVITQLHIAFRIGYISSNTLNQLVDKAEKIRASSINLIRSKSA